MDLEPTEELKEVAREFGRFAVNRQANSEWRPIETAPKEGCPVIILGNKDDVSEGRWKEKFWAWSASREGKCLPGCWVWAGEGEPTHWQPMPKPPNT